MIDKNMLTINFIDAKERLPKENGTYLVLINEIYDKNYKKIKLLSPKLAVCNFTTNGSSLYLKTETCFYETLCGDGAYHSELEGVIAWSEKEVLNCTYY